MKMKINHAHPVFNVDNRIPHKINHVFKVESSIPQKIKGVCHTKKISPIEIIEFNERRKILLDYFRIKQSFRVAIGKNKWIDYETFNPEYNMREILNDEIVIEFDNEDRNLTWTAINLTGVNLYKAGIYFEIWNHEGKSPHIHIHNLPIKNLNSDKRALWKKIFIRNYVPLKYLKWVDISLTGVHLIAIEWQNHWKGCYDYKRLLSKFNPKEDLGEEGVII